MRFLILPQWILMFKRMCNCAIHEHRKQTMIKTPINFFIVSSFHFKNTTKYNTWKNNSSTNSILFHYGLVLRE